MNALHLEPEHEMLRDQLRRFVEDEIKPKAAAWEETGAVPRDVLRRMGELGFFGIRCFEAGMPVAGQGESQHLADCRLVIDDQNCSHHGYLRDRLYFVM